MKPRELKLIKDCRLIQDEIENLLMTDLNDLICEHLDKILNKEYNEIYKLSDKVLKILDTIENIEDANNFNKYFTNAYDKLNDKSNYICDYLSEKSNLATEVLKLTAEWLKPLVAKTNDLVGIAFYLGYNKTGNNLHFMQKQNLNRVTFLLNDITDGVINPYKKSINEVIINVNNTIDEKRKIIIDKVNEIDNAKKQETQNKLKKILKSKDMNDLLEKQGYEAIRQTGSHKIYNNGINSVTVPQHVTLNKCLGFGIQKQVFNNI